MGCSSSHVKVSPNAVPAEEKSPLIQNNWTIEPPSEEPARPENRPATPTVLLAGDPAPPPPPPPPSPQVDETYYRPRTLEPLPGITPVLRRPSTAVRQALPGIPEGAGCTWEGEEEEEEDSETESEPVDLIKPLHPQYAARGGINLSFNNNILISGVSSEMDRSTYVAEAGSAGIHDNRRHGAHDNHSQDKNDSRDSDDNPLNNNHHGYMDGIAGNHGDDGDHSDDSDDDVALPELCREDSGVSSPVRDDQSRGERDVSPESGLESEDNT